MAEIRKHRTPSGQSAIARAVEEALGAAARPVTPGAPPVKKERSTPAAPSATVTSTFLAGAGWAPVRPDTRHEEGVDAGPATD